MRSQSAFVAPARFDDPAAALAQVRLIYDNSVAHLRDALQAFVADPAAGAAALGRGAKSRDAQTRVRACYPFVRVHTDTVARADSRLSYGFVAGPGTYETTLTRPDLFGNYYQEQFRLLLKNHQVSLEVGTSTQPIPVHFSLAENDHIEGSLSAERRLLMRTDWAFVHQNPRDGLRMGVSGGANVGERLMAVGARHYGDIRGKALSWLEKVEIDPARIDDLPSRYSGGMQQRLQIARDRAQLR